MPYRIRSSLHTFLTIAYASFWATVMIMRSVEFITLLFNRYPAIFIHGAHIHHFITGFVLILIVGALEVFSDFSTELSALLFGIGLALVADEFLYWTIGHFNYWSYANCIGTLGIAALLLLAVSLSFDDTLQHGEGSIAHPDVPTVSHASSVVPKVSVVIPAHNEEKYIEATLAALQAQSFRDFEIIVVDNNSTDDTAKLAREMGATVIEEHHVGVAHARQTGFTAARGEIIATTDADTIVPSDWIERIVRAFERNHGMVAYGGIYTLYSGPLSAKIIFPDIANIAWHVDRFFHGTWSLPGANMAVLASAFKQVGGFNTAKKVLEDVDLSHRIAAIGDVMYDRTLIVETSGRRYQKGFFRGTLPYVFRRGFNPVRDESYGTYSFLYPLLPAVLLIFLFAIRAPVVAEVHEPHTSHEYVEDANGVAHFVSGHIKPVMPALPHPTQKQQQNINAWKKHLPNI